MTIRMHIFLQSIIHSTHINMDNSKDTSTTTKQETKERNGSHNSHYSSYFEQDFQRPRLISQGPYLLHQFYPPITEYFPIYPSPWAVMNCLYLDYLKHLSLESELRNTLNTRINSSYNWNFLKDHQTKHNVNRHDCNKCKSHDSNNWQFNEENRTNCNQFCTSCLTQTKCISCGSLLVKNPSMCRCCQNNSDYCHKPKPPSNTMSRSTSSLPNHMPIDIPVRLTSDKLNADSIRKMENSKCNNMGFNENNNGVHTEKCSISPDRFATKKQPIQTLQEEDNIRKCDKQNDKTIFPEYFGGTGDDNIPVVSASDTLETCKKSPPKGTAYFLPISSPVANRKRL